MQFFVIIIILAALAVVNAIVPLPGFSVFVPMLSTVMTTQSALTFATFYFLISGLIIVFSFRKFLKPQLIKVLLPSSIIGALAGSASSSWLSEEVMTVVVLLFVSYFTVRKIQRIIAEKNVKRHDSNKGALLVGLVSGFFQGGGVGGGDVRNGYLYSKGLSLQEVRATTAAVGAGNFLVATIVRTGSGHADTQYLWVFLFVIPILIAATYMARHITTKLNETVQNYIIVTLMIASVILLLVRIVKLI